MSGNLRAIDEFEADLESRPLRGIDDQDYLDLLRSLSGIGGTMYVNGGEETDTLVTCSGSYERLDIWHGSRDTRGVQDGLGETPPKGRFKIKTNGGGDWSAAAMLHIHAIDAGTYRARVTVDEAGVLNPTAYRAEVTLAAGEEGVMVIAGATMKALEQAWYMQIDTRGNNGKQFYVKYGQFPVNR